MDWLATLAAEAARLPAAPAVLPPQPSASQTPPPASQLTPAWLSEAQLPPTWVAAGQLPTALLWPSPPPAPPEKPAAGRPAGPKKPLAAVKPELRRSAVVDCVNAGRVQKPKGRRAQKPAAPGARQAQAQAPAAHADLPLLRREPRDEDISGALGDIGFNLRRMYVMEGALSNNFSMLDRMPNAPLSDGELVEIFLAHGAAAGYPAVVSRAIALGARDFAAARAEAAAAASRRGRPAADAGRVEKALREAEARFARS